MHMKRTADRLFGDAYRWSVLAAGAAQMKVAAMAASMGGHVSVGLEDSLWLGRGELAPDMPGYHAVLAMHAFGLEETGLYASAEENARRAVEIEPRDGWAQHAVAHVMEMQGRQREGIAWMRA